MRYLQFLLFTVMLLVLGLHPDTSFAQDEQPVQGRIPIMRLTGPVEPLAVGERVILNVHMVNEEGRSLPNLPIEVYTAGEQLRRARTDEQGNAQISISDLPLGDHTLLVHFIGTRAYKPITKIILVHVRPLQFEIHTIPPLKDVQFVFDGQTVVTNTEGVAYVEVNAPGEYAVEVLPIPGDYVNEETRAEFQRWSDSEYLTQRTVNLTGDGSIEAGYIVSHRAQLRFYDLQGNPFDESRISTITLKTSTGDIHTLEDGQFRWLRSTRINRSRFGLEATDIMYSVESVMIDGSNTVNRYQQKFFVEPEDTWDIELLLYHAQITARDALFGFTVGNGMTVEYPDGSQRYFPYEEDQKIRIGPLARGEYRVKPSGVSGMVQWTPMALSRDQDVSLKALTTFDIVTSVGSGVVGAFSLLFYGRPWLMFLPWRSLRLAWGFIMLTWRNRRVRRVLRRAFPMLTIVMLLLPGFALSPTPRAAAQIDVYDPIPMMAYYYIWFTPSSWDRAKTDYSILGRYSSDDPDIMRQHIAWAKEAGIDGFIVSWKSTFQLDPRLETLMEIAVEEDFYLWIIYQGLDFDRNPLPIAQIDRDLDYFLERYAAHPSFQMYDRPIIIWSGTWEFSRDEIEAITGTYRDQLYILASERNTEDYLEIADIVDGNAYYWSSVNPATFPAYQQKLDEMGEKIHQYDGIWVAPAAPGFDARLIGGTRIVERQDGAMFRTQLNAAIRSSPDVIGIISWNEFSENSHIEPSENYGRMALDVLMGRNTARAPIIYDFDSSDPGTTDQGSLYQIKILMAMFALTFASGLVIVVRRVYHVTNN